MTLVDVGLRLAEYRERIAEAAEMLDVYDQRLRSDLIQLELKLSGIIEQCRRKAEALQTEQLLPLELVSLPCADNPA